MPTQVQSEPALETRREEGKHTRLDYLDCIRALAAMGVAYLHSDLELIRLAKGWDHQVLWFFALTLDTGKIGVIAFFMVSGFVIPLTFPLHAPLRVGLRNFVISRIFRLYPVYWLSIIAMTLIHLISGSNVFTAKEIFVNLTMFQGFIGVHDIIGAYWTLQIEWIFYLACMALFFFGWLANPKRLFSAYLVFLALSFALAVARLITHKPLPLAAPLAMCVMFAAALWRMVQIDKRTDAIAYLKISVGSFLACVPLVSILGYNFSAGHNENWYRYTLCYWLAVSSFLLLTSKAKITFRPLAAIGRASFSLYLFADVFGMLFEYWLPPERFPFASVNLYIVGKVFFDCVCSMFLYHGLEKPFIAWGKILIRRWGTSAYSTAMPHEMTLPRHIRSASMVSLSVTETSKLSSRPESKTYRQ